MSTRSIGRSYELKAINYLKNLGYLVIENNYSSRHGEIDIIALYEQYICFVEVKYRRNLTSGYADEAVSPSKITKICKCAEYYCYTHQKYQNYQMRFDVLAFNDDAVSFYPNAFDFSLANSY